MQLAITPKVSILIPCYNAQPYLTDCINSALNQSYSNIEIIMIDDGSSDKSLQIANNFPIKIYSQINKGQSYTRNKLFEMSTGEWIQYLDADDYLNKDKISKQLNLFQLKYKLNPSIKSSVLIDNYFCFLNSKVLKKHIHNLLFLNDLRQNIRHQTNSMLVSRQVYEHLIDMRGYLFNNCSTISSNIYLDLMQINETLNPQFSFFYTNKFNTYYRKHDKQQNNSLDSYTKNNLSKCDSEYFNILNLWFTLNSVNPLVSFEESCLVYNEINKRFLLFSERFEAVTLANRVLNK